MICYKKSEQICMEVYLSYFLDVFVLETSYFTGTRNMISWAANLIGTVLIFHIPTICCVEVQCLVLLWLWLKQFSLSEQKYTKNKQNNVFGHIDIDILYVSLSPPSLNSLCSLLTGIIARTCLQSPANQGLWLRPKAYAGYTLNNF